MRGNLSNENTKQLFILFLKQLSESIESCYSQQLSDETNVQNIQNKICPEDDFKNYNYIQERIGFKVTYFASLLSLIYKEIWFYYYSEEKNDLNIYKFNHESNILIITRSYAYTPVLYKYGVCILQKYNTKHFKSLIPQKNQKYHYNLL